MRHTRLTLALAAAAAIAAGTMVTSVALAAGAEPGPPLADAPAPAAPSQLKVLVLPFAPLTNADRDAWIGRAVAEALTADLSIDRALSVSTDKNQSVDNADNALVAAKLVGAQVVVYGTTQNVGENVRVTGQLIDVATGKPLAGIKATGPLQELFSLQDSLVHQIEIRLGRPGLPQPPPQPAPADSPLPLPNMNHDDGVLGVPKPTERRGIPWLDEENARSDQFLHDVRTAHDDYMYNYPSPAYYGPYYGPSYYRPIYYAPVWGVPIGGWGNALPFGWVPPGGYYDPGYYPYPYYYPHVSVSTSDGDGWNGRTQTQGHGIVGGAMRATPKVQPYQLGPGQPFYGPSAGSGNPQRTSNAPVQAMTNQVGNRQMPVSPLPDSPEVAARRAASTASVSPVRSAGGLDRVGPPARPPVRPTPVVSQQQQQQQQQQQNSQSGQTARR